MPVYGGSAQAGENYLTRVVSVFDPTSTEKTTVGPTTFQLFPVKAGDRVLSVECRIRELFDGGATMTVGDGDVNDGFMDAGDITEGTAGLYGGNAANQAKTGKLYTVDDTVDLFYTGNAATTTGKAAFIAYILRGEF